MKINFKFSPHYERILARNAVPLSIGERACTRIDHLWKKQRTLVEHELRNITGLRFQKKEITCYINSHTSFSEPLSLKIEGKKTMLDNLIHELIHVLLTHNSTKIEKRVKLFHASYKEYNFTTRIHILVHAIHLRLTSTLYPHRVRSIRTYTHDPDYRTSWDIVTRSGAENIISRVFK